MPITGSQHALMQCRSGIARCGATRSGYFYPNHVATTIGGVSRRIIVKSLDIVDDREPGQSRARFECTGFVPAVGQEVIIGHGTIANRLFHGYIVRIGHVQDNLNQAVIYDVDCRDASWKFDRQFITQYFGSADAGVIAAQIISGYTSGFTANHVLTGLGTIGYFPCTAERPSNALTRLAALVDGGEWYIDDFDDVHFYGAAGETDVPVPATLANTTPTFSKFTYDFDLTQVRTRVIVNGEGRQLLSAVAAGQLFIPLEDVTFYSDLFLSTQLMIDEYGLISPSLINFGIAITSAVNTAASAGATSLKLDDITGFTGGWFGVGDGLYIYTTGTTATGPGSVGTLDGIPATGPGSITRAVAVGERVHDLPQFGVAGGFTSDLPQGASVTLYVVRNDAGKQAALAALEGGDGVHEYYIQDRRLNLASCQELGDSELAALGEAVTNASFISRDANMRAGRPVSVSLTGQTNLTASLHAQRVQINGFLGTRAWPERTVTAGQARSRDIRDRLAARGM